MSRTTLIFIGLVLASVTAWGEESPVPSGNDFAQLPALAGTRLSVNRDFWVRIYTQYSTQQGLLHDAKYIDHVYEVLDFRGAKVPHGRITRLAKQKYKAILLSVHRKQKTPDKMTAEELRIFQLFSDIDEPNKFLNAAHRRRLRFQLGQKDRFISGIKESSRYLPYMEEVFKNSGLPVELTRLPFVESSFNTRARSKVGASGIWQFMRSTGRLFLTINQAVDERNDPIRATEAAAQLLRVNYESLGAWPLAVTAYNHGRTGMMKAVRRVGSLKLDDIVEGYKSRTFGFASSNFYPELQAAIEVEKNAKHYFGEVERLPLLKFAEVRVPDYVDMRDLVSLLKLDVSVLKSLNPALSEEVWKGQLWVPVNYALRLPVAEADTREMVMKVFFAGYEQIPPIYKKKTQRLAGLGVTSAPKRHKRK